jgi:hypothetical protein
MKNDLINVLHFTVKVGSSIMSITHMMKRVEMALNL